MKLCHNISVSVFVKPEEDRTVLEQGLRSLFPFDIDKEKILLISENAKGFNERSITILSVRLAKERHISAFLESLFHHLGSATVRLLEEQKESRFDESLNFFIRLDKEGVKNGTLLLTDGGNCFHIRIAVAAYPKKRENGVLVLNKLFQALFP